MNRVEPLIEKNSEGNVERNRMESSDSNYCYYENKKILNSVGEKICRFEGRDSKLKLKLEGQTDRFYEGKGETIRDGNQVKDPFFHGY